VLFTPGWFPAGTSGIMALFRFHHADITDCQFPRTGKAVPLLKTFLNQPATGNAVYPAGKFDAQLAANMLIQRNKHRPQRKLIGNRVIWFAHHFGQVAGNQVHIQVSLK